jgi:hypothetical protein
MGSYDEEHRLSHRSRGSRVIIAAEAEDLKRRKQVLLQDLPDQVMAPVLAIVRYARAIACQPPSYPMPVLSCTSHPSHPDTTDGSSSGRMLVHELSLRLAVQNT